MVRYRTGRLRFNSVSNTQDVELYVSPGYLTAMISGDRSITEEWKILDKLVAITASAEGSFTFEPCAPSDLKQTVRVSIDGIMLAVVTNIDEILSSHAKMPNSNQLYRFTPGRETLTFENDATLTAFLEVARSDLDLGVCAGEIAKRLEINPKQVQFYFLKLIEFGMIEKMRAEDSPLVSDPRLVLKSSEIKVDEEKLEDAARPPILSRESRSRHLPRKGKVTRLI